MKKRDLALILFFSGLWGLSEAVLGGWLYKAGIGRASVILTVIALGILTVGRCYLPRLGSCTLIAGCAMLYKLLNAPMFACHFWGIMVLGVSCDLIFGLWLIKNKSLSAVVAAYLNCVVFAVLMTYVIHYGPWVQAGMDKFLGHIAIDGTLTALGGAIMVPLSHRFGGWLQTRKQIVSRPMVVGGAGGRLALVTAGIWVFALGAFVLHFHG